MKINLQFPKLGHDICNVAYVIDYLENVELSIKKTARGSIGLYVNEKGKQEKELVAIYEPNASERTKTTYWQHEEAYYTPFPGETEQTIAEKQVTFFSVLTPSASVLVEDFLRQCVHCLRITLEADGREPQPEIVISIQA